MGHTKAERDTIDAFDASYGLARSEVMQAIERSVCGCNYGGTSWTTREEALALGERLSLTPDKTLLEVGSGSGWPSLFLSKEFGCAAVLVDLPLEGLRLAGERAQADGLSERCRIVQADAAALPLADKAFDAIAHSDVLCCLMDKLGVLRECRRTVRDDGRLAFTVIYVDPEIRESERAEAIAAGPPFVDTDMEYERMLAQTGWRITSQIDLTHAFVESVRRMVATQRQYASGLKAVMGTAEATDWLLRTQSKLPALERGLLRRTLFVAEPI